MREEIELAKTEIELKVQKLARGAAVAVAAGFFLLLALIFAFDAIAWGINDATGSLWLGFVIVSALLLVLAAVAGYRRLPELPGRRAADARTRRSRRRSAPRRRSSTQNWRPAPRPARGGKQ